MSLTKAAEYIFGGAALGWVSGFILPIFLKNTTGDGWINAQIGTLVTTGSLQMVFISLGLFAGVIVAIKSVGQKK